MRSIAILALLVVFVVAVVLPNDIGTHELPATGCKCVKALQHQVVKGKAVAWFVVVGNQCDASPTSDTQRLVYRSMQTVANVQHTSPLLI